MFLMRSSSLDTLSGLHFQLPPTTGLRPMAATLSKLWSEKKTWLPNGRSA